MDKKPDPRLERVRMKDGPEPEHWRWLTEEAPPPLVEPVPL